MGLKVSSTNVVVVYVVELAVVVVHVVLDLVAEADVDVAVCSTAGTTRLSDRGLRYCRSCPSGPRSGWTHMGKSPPGLGGASVRATAFEPTDFGVSPKQAP